MTLAAILADAHPLVHANAALNATATLLLLIGYALIKRRREVAHKRVMLLAFAVSTVFLVCYLYYHNQVGHVKFAGPGAVRYVYWSILASHILLAAATPVLALATIYFGHHALSCRSKSEESCPDDVNARRARYRQRHRKLARITFPIWLYVSITGVVIYVMLYHVWPPA